MHRLLLVAAGILILIPFERAHATECVAIPLKPVQHVWGVVVNQAGEFVSGATATVLKGSDSIASARTGTDGGFAFDELKAGTYDIRVDANGYLGAFSPITLVKPNRRRKNGLEVLLAVGMGCSVLSVHKIKKPKQ
jgi:Carboxypeptidase regulatory-like domain